MSLLVLRVRRVLRHLMRSTARTGWVVVVLSALVYFAIPWKTTDEFAVVLAGVAAGAIFLPELNARLWQMNAADVRETIPRARVERLQRELIASQVELPGWSEHVWNQGLSPLLEAGRDSQAVRRNVVYDVEVRLRQRVVTSRGPVVMNRIRTELGSERFLPPGLSEMFVSVARTSDALLREFRNPGCLSRELVSLPSIVGAATDEEWQAAVIETTKVLVGVGGAPVRLEDCERDGKVVRWRVPVPAPTDRRVRVTTIIEFLDEPSTRTFPVIFAHYYCVDATSITFNLEKNGCLTSLHAAEFFARGLGCPAGELQSYPEDDRASVRYVSPEGSLLWPGSGLLLHWDPEQVSDEVAGGQPRRPAARGGAARTPGTRTTRPRNTGDTRT